MTPRFVQLEHWLLDHPSVLALSGDTFKVMVYLAKRFNGHNNGVVGFGVRSGCTIRVSGTESICKPIFPLKLPRRRAQASRRPRANNELVVQGKIKRALDELEAADFIVCTQPATFHQKRMAREWRLTWLHTGTPERPTAPT
jgi:hypothetical protein